MKLAELVNKYYRNLNENDLLIWKYIDANKQLCEHLAIDELAQRCHVSRTTILRFAQKLSLKGYAELKVYLKWENSETPAENRHLNQVIQIYNHVMDSMRQKDLSMIFQKLDQAKSLYVYGTGAVQSTVAMEMKRIFQTSGKFFYLISANDESDTLINMIDEQDLVFIISLSGESNHVKEFARKLKIKNVPLISVTKEKENTLAHLCDHNLYISTIYASSGEKRVPFQASTSFFIILEMLYIRYLEYEEGLNSK